MTQAAKPRRDVDLFIAVAVGGVIGALARHWVDVVFPTPADAWPLATFIINLSGAFILGLVIEAATAYAPDPGASNVARRLRPFLVTGVLGGYTTFSTYMVDAHGLAVANRGALAALYLFGSMAAGVALVIFGMILGKAMFRGTRRSAEQAEADEEEIRLTEDEA